MSRAAIDRLVDGAFLIAMTGAAWLAVFGHRGLAPCVGLMALAAAMRPEIWRSGVFLFAPRRLAADPLSTAAAAAMLFSAWTAATALWSPTPGAEWLALTVAVAVLAGAALVHEALRASPGRARRFAVFFSMLTAATAAALMFEALTDGYMRRVIPPTDESPYRWKDLIALGRGVTAVAPLVFPAAVIVRKLTGSWAVALSPAAALFIAATHFTVFANVAALFAGAVAFIVAAARPKSCAAALAALIIGSLALAPFIAASAPADVYSEAAANALPASWEQRIAVWKAASDRALNECMPLGCGADYARAWSAEGATVAVRASTIPLPEMPIHPHNVFIQVWLELGLPGVFAMIFALGAAARALLKSKIDRLAMAAVCGASGVSFISVMFEASLWQVWRLAVFALAAFGCAVSYSMNKSKQ